MIQTKVTTIGRQNIYLTPADQIRVGAKGPPHPVEEVYGSMDKGKARQVRKALHRLGRVDLARLPRV
jgi:hypothetical protein